MQSQTFSQFLDILDRIQLLHRANLVYTVVGNHIRARATGHQSLER